MERHRRRRARVAGALITLTLVLAGCSPSTNGHGHVASSAPEATSISPPPAAARVAGTATDDSGAPVAGVMISFLRRAAGVKDPQIATTGADGTYQVQLVSGAYISACIAPSGSCSVGDATSDGVADVIVADTALTVDIAVTGSPITSDPPPAPPADNPPPAANDGASFSGHAYTPAGQAVRGITIEFATSPGCDGVCDEPFVNTDDSGAYSIQLDDGSYNAMCVVSGSTDYDCGPRGGDGGPFLVQVPPQGQRLDFVVCRVDDYPQCLRS